VIGLVTLGVRHRARLIALKRPPPDSVKVAARHHRETTMLLFDLDLDTTFGKALGADLDQPLSPVEARVFADGEAKTRPLVDPRGDDVYLIQSLHGDDSRSPHDKLVALLMMAATLRDHGASRVTAVVPYLAYARKDRRTKDFDPVGSRYVAQLLEAVGIAQLIVLEAHNPAALENAFRGVTIHLEAHHAFDAVADEFRHDRIVVASPDPGGVKRAQLWREHLERTRRLETGFAMLDKRRSAEVVSGLMTVAGDVAGATVLLVDDLVATGQTLARAAWALRKAGAARVVACAAHGLFVGDANEALADDSIDRIVVCDSVPPFRVAPGSGLQGRLQVRSAVALFGRAIRDSHSSWRN